MWWGGGSEKSRKKGGEIGGGRDSRCIEGCSEAKRDRDREERLAASVEGISQEKLYIHMYAGICSSGTSVRFLFSVKFTVYAYRLRLRYE